MRILKGFKFEFGHRGENEVKVKIVSLLRIFNFIENEKVKFNFLYQSDTEWGFLAKS